jgi:type III restriction enzyme
LLRNGIVTQHIVKEIGKLVFDMQNSVDIKEAEYRRIYFSEIKEMKIRENYSLNIVKSIYPQLKYPSNKGGFEKDFMEFIDNDSEVKSFIKIDENYHNFAKI